MWQKSGMEVRQEKILTVQFKLLNQSKSLLLTNYYNFVTQATIMLSIWDLEETYRMEKSIIKG